MRVFFLDADELLLRVGQVIVEREDEMPVLGCRLWFRDDEVVEVGIGVPLCPVVVEKTPADPLLAHHSLHLSHLPTDPSHYCSDTPVPVLNPA